MGRLTSTTTAYSFLTGRNFVVSYGYDAASNRTDMTDPESGVSSYAYDSLNRLATLTPPSAISGPFAFSYDALSRRTQLARPNGVSTNFAYDSLSRLLSVLHQFSGNTIDGTSYTVDNVGNRTAKTDLPTSTTSNFSYDSIYQLTQVVQNLTTSESYSYDNVGIRLSQHAVPTATNTGVNLPVATFCRVFGSFQPFDADALDVLYPNHGMYLSQVTKTAHQNLRNGFIMVEDAIATVRDAALSTIGKP